jgi:hypothetical protein
MIRAVRRCGIALGSLVIAWLAVGLVGGVFLPLFGVTPTTAHDLTPGTGNVVMTLVVVVLGGLIYRDIIRREQRST